MEEEFERLEQMLAPVIPAYPGFTLLNYSSFDEEVTRYPVIGWRVFDEYVEPVTARERTESGWHILQPDGRVVQAYVQEWDNEAAWLETQRKEAAKERQRKVLATAKA